MMAANSSALMPLTPRISAAEAQTVGASLGSPAEAQTVVRRDALRCTVSAQALADDISELVRAHAVDGEDIGAVIASA